MGIFTDDIDDAIADAIADLGTTCTFYKNTAGAFNAGTMSRAKTATPTTNVPILFDESIERFAGKASLEEISARVRVAALIGIVPDNNDQVEVDLSGQTLVLRVVGVTRVAGGQVWRLRFTRLQPTV